MGLERSQSICNSFVLLKLERYQVFWYGLELGQNVNGWDSHSAKSFVCNGLPLSGILGRLEKKMK